MASKGAALKRQFELGMIGTPAVNCAFFTLVTNDNEAAIETDGYLDDDYQRFPQGASSVLFILADRDGTPTGLAYVVTRTDGDIALTTFKGMG